MNILMCVNVAITKLKWMDVWT